MADEVGVEGERPAKKSLRVVLKLPKKATPEEETDHAQPLPEIPVVHGGIAAGPDPSPSCQQPVVAHPEGAVVGLMMPAVAAPTHPTLQPTGTEPISQETAERVPKIGESATMGVDAKKVSEATPSTPSTSTAAESKPKRSHKRKPPVPPPAPLTKQVHDVLTKLQKRDKGGIFAEPVTEAVAPGYLRIIKAPMDLHTMWRKAGGDQPYASWEAVWKDAETMFKNAMIYNTKGTVFYRMGDQMLKFAKTVFEPLTKKEAKLWEEYHAKLNAPPVKRKRHGAEDAESKVPENPQAPVQALSLDLKSISDIRAKVAPGVARTGTVHGTSDEMPANNSLLEEASNRSPALPGASTKEAGIPGEDPIETAGSGSRMAETIIPSAPSKTRAAGVGSMFETRTRIDKRSTFEIRRFSTVSGYRPVRKTILGPLQAATLPDAYYQSVMRFASGLGGWAKAKVLAMVTPLKAPPPQPPRTLEASTELNSGLTVPILGRSETTERGSGTELQRQQHHQHAPLQQAVPPAASAISVPEEVLLPPSHPLAQWLPRGIPSAVVRSHGGGQPHSLTKAVLMLGQSASKSLTQIIQVQAQAAQPQRQSPGVLPVCSSMMVPRLQGTSGETLSSIQGSTGGHPSGPQGLTCSAGPNAAPVSSGHGFNTPVTQALNPLPLAGYVVGSSNGVRDPQVESEVHVGHIMSLHAPHGNFQSSNAYFQSSPQLPYQHSGNDISANPLAVPGLFLGHAPAFSTDVFGINHADGELLSRDGVQ